MTRDEVRNAFQAFCGVERYRRFLADLNGMAVAKGRFLYWQEELLERFAASLSEALPRGFADLARLFALCHVHGNELEHDEVPVVYGLMHFPDGYLDACDQTFPLANTDVLGGCLVREEATETVLFCAECRRVKARWKRS